MKAIAKAVGILMWACGTLSISFESPSNKPLFVALAGLALVAFCQYHDYVVEEREAYEARRLR